MHSEENGEGRERAPFPPPHALFLPKTERLSRRKLAFTKQNMFYLCRVDSGPWKHAICNLLHIASDNM